MKFYNILAHINNLEIHNENLGQIASLKMARLLGRNSSCT